MTNILKAELIATLAKIQTVGSKEHHALGLVKLAIQGANSIDAIEGVITGASALIGYVDWLAKCAAILSWFKMVDEFGTITIGYGDCFKKNFLRVAGSEAVKGIILEYPGASESDAQEVTEYIKKRVGDKFMLVKAA